MFRLLAFLLASVCAGSVLADHAPVNRTHCHGDRVLRDGNCVPVHMLRQYEAKRDAYLARKAAGKEARHEAKLREDDHRVARGERHRDRDRAEQLARREEARRDRREARLDRDGWRRD